MLHGFKITALASAAVVAMGLSAANADPIIGGISFSSQSFQPAGGASLSSATGIDFDVLTIDAEACSGSFLAAGACSPDMGTIKDFSFEPLAEFGVAAGPIADFWTKGIFSFDLESIVVTMEDGNSLVLDGMGTLSGVGFDDTPGAVAVGDDQRERRERVREAVRPSGLHFRCQRSPFASIPRGASPSSQARAASSCFRWLSQKAVLSARITR